jgi:hypothetical protein
MMVPAQPRQKSSKDLTSTEKSWAWWYMPAITAMAGSVKQENDSPGQPGQKVTTYLQNNQNKKGMEAWLEG